MIDECRNLIDSVRQWLRSAGELEVVDYHETMVSARMDRLENLSDKNRKKDLAYMPRFRHRENGKFTIDWSRKLWMGPRGKQKYHWSGLNKVRSKPSYRMSEFKAALPDEMDLVRTGEARFKPLRQAAMQLNKVESEMRKFIKIVEANSLDKNYPPEKLADLIERSNALLAENRSDLFKSYN